MGNKAQGKSCSFKNGKNFHQNLINLTSCCMFWDFLLHNENCKKTFKVNILWKEINFIIKDSKSSD